MLFQQELLFAVKVLKETMGTVFDAFLIMREQYSCNVACEDLV